MHRTRGNDRSAAGVDDDRARSAPSLLVSTMELTSFAPRVTGSSAAGAPAGVTESRVSPGGSVVYGPAAPRASPDAMSSPAGPRTSSCAGAAALITRSRACVGSGADRSSVKVVTPPSAPTVATVMVVPACTEMVLATIGGSVDPALRVAIT